MTLEEIILAIQRGTIRLEQIPEARSVVENEIDACEVVLKDPETEAYGRNEYRAKLTLYKKILNRL
jgi:hypothetical protein